MIFCVFFSLDIMEKHCEKIVPQVNVTFEDEPASYAKIIFLNGEETGWAILEDGTLFTSQSKPAKDTLNNDRICNWIRFRGKRVTIFRSRIVAGAFVTNPYILFGCHPAF